MKRRDLLACLAGAATMPGVAFAQPAQRRARIGWLVFGDSKRLGPIDKPTIAELEKRGLADGRNLEIIFRYAQGEPARLNSLATEIVSQNPDLLFGIGGDVIKAFFDATHQIPIVGGVSDNPMRAGFSTSLARPDKNFTGVSFITDEMAAKRLELLKEVFPAAKRIGVIWNPQHLDDEITFARRAALSLGVELSSFEAGDAAGLEKALSGAADSGVDSLFVIPSRLTSINAGQIGAFARGRKLPVMTAWREFVEGDCLLSYGPNRRYEAVTMAAYIDRILKGAALADLPIQLPSKFEMVVNMKTANAIGLTIPAWTLLRADELIE